MAKLGQYKALGELQGGYKEREGEIAGMDYSKKFADFKSQQAQSSWNELGSTAAEVIGIVKELKDLSKIKGYAESAKELSGVGKRKVTYQPLGKLGERIGLETKTKDEFYNRETNKKLENWQLSNIGAMEEFGVETPFRNFKYKEDDSPLTRPDEWQSTELEENYDELMDWKMPVPHSSRTEEAYQESLLNFPNYKTPEDTVIKGGYEAYQESLDFWERTTKSPEDTIIDDGLKAEAGIIPNQNNEGLSKFEEEIARAENVKYFEGDDSMSTYTDKDTKTGKDRAAEGYGALAGKTKKTRAQNNMTLKNNIKESELNAKKLMGSNWKNIPDDKKEVMTELVFQMGPNRLKEFPRFLEAMSIRDYKSAANELLYTENLDDTSWAKNTGKERIERIIKKLNPNMSFKDESSFKTNLASIVDY